MLIRDGYTDEEIAEFQQEIAEFQQEIAEFQQLLEHTAHSFFRYAEMGGLKIAKNI